MYSVWEGDSPYELSSLLSYSVLVFLIILLF